MAGIEKGKYRGTVRKIEDSLKYQWSELFFYCLKYAFYKDLWNIRGQEQFFESCTWTWQWKPNWRLGFWFWVSKVRSTGVEPNREFLPLRYLPRSSLPAPGDSIILRSPIEVAERLSWPCEFFPPYTPWKPSFLRSKLLFFNLELELWASSVFVSVGHPDISRGSVFSSAFQQGECNSLPFVLWLLGDPCWSLGDITAFSDFPLGLPRFIPVIKFQLPLSQIQFTFTKLW